eukprot:XP_016662418.1 PREDICTED: uncharacterized protein LOC107884551 isoform X2 [Acyrthosiphon pisum]
MSGVLKMDLLFHYILCILLSKLETIVVDDPAVCPNGCGHKYKGKWRKYNLKSHLMYGCRVPRQFRCNICCRTFVQKVSLKTHVAKVHKVIYE